MHRLRHFLIAASLLIFSGIALATVPVSATGSDLFDDVCRGNAASSSACQDADTNQNPIFGNRGSILNQVVNILAIIIGVAAVIMLIVGGINYILSGGDPAKINSAKNTIIYALIGIVVAVVARGIVALVVNRF